MNHLIGVFRIIIKIIQDFSILLPINPSIIRLPIGITSNPALYKQFIDDGWFISNRQLIDDQRFISGRQFIDDKRLISHEVQLTDESYPQQQYRIFHR